MPTLAIKDLTKNDDLDREAMTTIVGGARVRGRQPATAANRIGAARIVDYPPGFGQKLSPLKTTLSK